MAPPYHPANGAGAEAKLLLMAISGSAERQTGLSADAARHVLQDVSVSGALVLKQQCCSRLSAVGIQTVAGAGLCLCC